MSKDAGMIRRGIKLIDALRKFARDIEDEVLAFDLEDLADDIEARVMKKTTQRSPEWHGGTNKSMAFVV